MSNEIKFLRLTTGPCLVYFTVILTAITLSCFAAWLFGSVILWIFPVLKMIGLSEIIYSILTVFFGVKLFDKTIYFFSEGLYEVFSEKNSRDYRRGQFFKLRGSTFFDKIFRRK